jgi:hypothetical protein
LNDTEQTWRVLIQFQEKKIAYMAHIPDEVQQRGYRKDRLYRNDPYYNHLHHLLILTAAASPDEAVLKAKQMLLAYVQESQP